MFGNDRDSMRRYYLQCWQKFKQKQPLDALETQEHETRSERPRRPLFHWPLAAAVALLGLYLLSGVLGARLKPGLATRRERAAGESEHG